MKNIRLILPEYLLSAQPCSPWPQHQLFLWIQALPFIRALIRCTWEADRFGIRRCGCEFGLHHFPAAQPYENVSFGFFVCEMELIEVMGNAGVLGISVTFIEYSFSS